MTSSDDTISWNDSPTLINACRHGKYRDACYEQSKKEVDSESWKTSLNSSTAKNENSRNNCLQKEKEIINLRKYFSDIRRTLCELDGKWKDIDDELKQLDDLRKLEKGKISNILDSACNKQNWSRLLFLFFFARLSSLVRFGSIEELSRVDEKSETLAFVEAYGCCVIWDACVVTFVAFAQGTYICLKMQLRVRLHLQVSCSAIEIVVSYSVRLNSDAKVETQKICSGGCDRVHKQGWHYQSFHSNRRLKSYAALCCKICSKSNESF